MWTGEMMGELKIGVEFWPWDSYGELMAFGREALETYPYDSVWMCDEFQYEDAITVLGSMAMELDASVGTMVTFPWRNPLELAQRFATMSKQTRPGRQVAIGMGGGGSVQTQVIGEKGNPLAVMRESVQLLRGLLSGRSVELAGFPELAARFRYNTATSAKLYFPPMSESVPVYLAAGGPKMLALAGAEADGVIITQLQVRHCPLGTGLGLFAEDMEIVEAARQQSPDPDRPFKRLYNFHLSVARNGHDAVQWAKRNASYGLTGAYLRYPHFLDDVGIDREAVGYVAEAYQKGLGLEEAARRVTDDMVTDTGLVIAGTPDEVADALRAQLEHVEAAGFDHAVMGVPLGPDVSEALKLLGKEVLPAVLG